MEKPSKSQIGVVLETHVLEGEAEVGPVVVEVEVEGVHIIKRRGITKHLVVKTRVESNVIIARSSDTMQLSVRIPEEKEIKKTI